MREIAVKLNEDLGFSMDDCNRCGLCCVVPPTTTFCKNGVVCEHLKLEGEGTGCAIYNHRPLECRSFNCDYPTTVKRFKAMILDMKTGCPPVIYYREKDSDYSEAEDPSIALNAITRLGLLLNE